jgi:SAM-dependent methyltransferase
MSATNPGALRLLFHTLREAGYDWHPQTPDRLVNFRKDPAPFRPLIQWLGLGLAVRESEIMADGITPGIMKVLRDQGFAADAPFEAAAEPPCKSAMAVSVEGDVFVVHDHWPPDPAREGGYVHYGPESEWLARALHRDLEGFIGKRVLDLGCGSGALAFEIGGVADEVLGLDVSERAIEWSRATAKANGVPNIRFEVASVGTPASDELAGGAEWDSVVMNPPMIVPEPGAPQGHRDGGELGIELPLRFLDFARRHLREGGEVITLATNPIVGGKGLFFDRIGGGSWEIMEKRCLNSHFNQNVARKRGHDELGIERIELWFLHLKRL